MSKQIRRSTKKTNLAPNNIYSSGTSVAEGSQYSNKPIEPSEVVYAINEINIQQVQRKKLQVHEWRDAHQTAESRYAPNRSWLYDIYDDILLDGHLTGILDKRWDTILNKHLVFKGKDGKEIDGFSDLIRSVAFRNVCREILETQGWGITGIEFEPGPKFAPRIIPRKHINTKYQVITIDQNGQEGIDYTKAMNIMVLGEPEDLGMYLKCAAYVIYKRNGLADWAQYISIFGQPVRVMKYNTNDIQAKVELKKTLDKSGSSLALMIPNTVDFDLKDGKQSNGDGALQNKFSDYCDKQLSIIVLSNTETTTHDGKTGTGGKSQVHKEQQEERSKSDMFYLLSQINSDQFKLILKSYGYKVEGGSFINTQEISIEYLAQRILIDKELVAMGVPLDDDYFYETYGCPKPDNYDELKAKLEEMNEAIAKQLKGGNDPEEEIDPEKPAPKKKPKALRHIGYGRVSKVRNLLNAFSAFFDQAR